MSARKNKKIKPSWYCTLGLHSFTGTPIYIKHSGVLSFVNRVNPQFKKDWEVCPKCFHRLVKIYKQKMLNAMRKQSMTVQSATDQSTNASDSSDNNLISHKENNRNSNNQSNRISRSSVTTRSTTTTNPSTSTIIATSSPTVRRHSVRLNNPSSAQQTNIVDFFKRNEALQRADQQPPGIPNSESSLSDQPTTSAAAAVRAQAKRHRNPVTATVVENIDDEWEASPNALNGSRLPEVQPILKRRQFVHANKDVMDIYLAGTTGG